MLHTPACDPARSAFPFHLVSKSGTGSSCINRALIQTTCSSESHLLKASTDTSVRMNGETGSPSERHLVPPASKERRRQWIERRARRDWKRRLRAHIVSGLTDDILRDLLIRPAEERDEHRNILDMETVRQYVPLEFEGRSVPDADAARELTWATEDAVKRRLRGIES